MDIQYVQRSPLHARRPASYLESKMLNQAEGEETLCQKFKRKDKNV